MQMSSLIGVGSSLPQHTSLVIATSQQGRPAFVVHSFVTTFALPNPWFVLFRTSASLASALQAISSESLLSLLVPILHQSFGPGIFPIPAKLVR